jgi:hypothetical protein
MRVPVTVRWLGLALLGILIAAAISIAASRLASQQIGLASQPVSAGDALAPAGREGPRQHRSGRKSGNHPKAPRQPPMVPSLPPTPSEPPTYSAPPPSTPPYEPSQPSSHDGEHSGGGVGGGADD